MTSEEQEIIEEVKARLMLNSSMHDCRYFTAVYNNNMDIIKYDKVTGEFTFE